MFEVTGMKSAVVEVILAVMASVGTSILRALDVTTRRNIRVRIGGTAFIPILVVNMFTVWDHTIVSTSPGVSSVTIKPGKVIAE